MKKNLNYLNEKWWYRLIKVIFVGFVLLSVVISTILIIDENKPRKIKDYKIDCIANYTNKKSFFAEKDANIYIFQYGTDTPYQALSVDDKKKIRETCDISDEEANTANQKAITYINEQISLGIDKSTIQKYIDNNMRAYLISETYRTEGGYILVIMYSLLSILITLIIAEIIRRIFYYITLGSFLPEKPKKYLFFKIKCKE